MGTLYLQIKEQQMINFPDDDPTFDDMGYDGDTPVERQPISAEMIKRHTSPGDDTDKLVRAAIQERVDRRALFVAMTTQSFPPTPAPTSTSTSKPVESVKTAGFTNTPKGEFLLAIRKGGASWRIQLSATEMSDGTKVPFIRFRLWGAGEGGRPASSGPGSGFSLRLAEAKMVIEALKDGIARVKSGKFDPNQEGNYVPRRKDGY